MTLTVSDQLEFKYPSGKTSLHIGLSLKLINQVWRYTGNSCIFLSTEFSFKEISCWQKIFCLFNFCSFVVADSVIKNKKCRAISSEIFFKLKIHARADNLIFIKFFTLSYMYKKVLWNYFCWSRILFFFQRYTNEDVEFFKSMPVFVETDE